MVPSFGAVDELLKVMLPQFFNIIQSNLMTAGLISRRQVHVGICSQRPAVRKFTREQPCRFGTVHQSHWIFSCAPRERKACGISLIHAHLLGGSGSIRGVGLGYAILCLLILYFD